MKKAIYLKVNMQEQFTFRNLSQWLSISFLLGYDTYIICDKEELKEEIQERIILSDYAKFITSIRDENAVAKEIIDNACEPKWRNAGYSHLTTFLHAKANGYDWFWNIDADDTLICLSGERARELLLTAESYAEKNKIDCFSLDMWRTFTNGKDWSFGVTYINSKYDWVDLLLCYSKDRKRIIFTLDYYFTYLKNVCDNLKMETFYFENLKFIHYHNDFFYGYGLHGLFHWKNEKLTFPVVTFCFEVPSLGTFKILDSIKLDIKIEDEETKKVLIYISQVAWFSNIYKDECCDEEIINSNLYMQNMKIINKKTKLYNERYIQGREVVIWGAGKCFIENHKKFTNYFNVKYICDSDANKQGKVLDGGIRCISPDELKQMKNVFVMVMIDKDDMVKDVKNKLGEIGVNNYDTLYNYEIITNEISL